MTFASAIVIGLTVVALVIFLVAMQKHFTAVQRPPEPRPLPQFQIDLVADQVVEILITRMGDRIWNIGLIENHAIKQRGLSQIQTKSTNIFPLSSSRKDYANARTQH